MSLTANEANGEAIDALESRVKWLTEEVTDLRSAGDVLAEKADLFVRHKIARNELLGALADWSETRETYDHE